MTGSHSFKRIKIFLAVVIFAFLSILLWNVCFNRHSMTGVVIENKNQIKIEATEKDFVDSHGKYFVIRFEKGKENRNDDFLVDDGRSCVAQYGRCGAVCRPYHCDE